MLRYRVVMLRYRVVMLMCTCTLNTGLVIMNYVCIITDNFLIR